MRTVENLRYYLSDHNVWMTGGSLYNVLAPFDLTIPRIYRKIHIYHIRHYETLIVAMVRLGSVPVRFRWFWQCSVPITEPATG